MKAALRKVFATADSMDDISISGVLTMSILMLSFVVSFLYFTIG